MNRFSALLLSCLLLAQAGYTRQTNNGVELSDKKAWISQYIKDHHPDLSNKEELISLVRGAEQ